MGVLGNPADPHHSETIDRLLQHAVKLAKLRNHTMLVYLINMAIDENASAAAGTINRLHSQQP